MAINMYNRLVDSIKDFALHIPMVEFWLLPGSEVLVCYLGPSLELKNTVTIVSSP